MRWSLFVVFNWLFIKPYTFYWVAGAVVVGGAIAGAISGRKSRKASARAKRELNALNDKFIDAETAEDVRKLRATKEQSQGYAKAAIGASGTSMEGTNEKYVQEMERQFQGEKNWLNKSALSRKKISRVETNLGISSDKARERSDLIGSATSIAGFFKP